MKNKRKKSIITYDVIDHFDQGGSVDGFISAFLYSCGSSSLFRHYLRYGVPQRTIRKKIQKKEEYTARKRCFTMLSRLEKEGILISSGRGENKKITITEEGKTTLKTKTIYKKEKTEDLIITMFDIPERLRKERNWIRTALKELSFTMIQQSVWMGDNKIPEDFIKDLKTRKIIKFVEIIRINNPGTIERIKNKN